MPEPVQGSRIQSGYFVDKKELAGPISLYAPSTPNPKRNPSLPILKAVLITAVLFLGGLAWAKLPSSFKGDLNRVWGSVARVLALEGSSEGTVLAERSLALENFTLNVNVPSRFKDSVDFLGGVPFSVSSAALVSDLNADLLDGQDSSFYRSWGNVTGKPITLSSLDGVTNDRGNIDLLAGANITITPDDILNTITLDVAGGSGSGLDADRLDNLTSDDFLRSNTSDSFTSGILTFDAITTLDVSLAALTLADNQIDWGKVDKTGSSLADLATRSAGDLSSGNLDIARMPAGGNWDVTSDLTVESTTLFVGATGGSYAGRVGIGIATPAESLHLAGNLLLDKTGTALSSTPYDSYALKIRGSGWEEGWMSPQSVTSVGDGAGALSSTSIALGSDGFARIAFYEGTNDDLVFVRCTNADCSAKNVTIVDAGGNVGQTNSMALGSDGFARIAYHYATGGDLKFARCLNADCTSANITSVDTTGTTGQETSITLDGGDLAYISYLDSSNFNLMFARCTNADCTSANIRTLASTNAVGEYSSIALGTDGFARISYFYNTGGDLRLARCNDADCTAPTITTIDTTDTVGYGTSIAMESDGYARIAYYDLTNAKLKFAQCTDATCSTKNITVIGDAGRSGFGGYTGTRALALGSDGFARIAYPLYNGTDFDLRFVKCTNASCSTNQISILVATANSEGYWTSIALSNDGENRPYISYYDATANVLAFIAMLPGTAQDRAISLVNTVTDSTTYRLSVKNNSSTEVFYIDQAGNLVGSGGLTLAGQLVVNRSFSGTTSGQAGLFTLTNPSTSGSQYGLYLDNAASSGATEALLVVDNSDTDTAIAAGIQFINAGGGFTSGIDMANLIITNIGNGGTDFTSTGGLTLAGSLTVGAGTAITQPLSASASIDVASVDAQTCANTVFTVTSAAAGDTVVATPTPVASGIETLNLSWNAYVSAASTVQIRVCNPTAGALDPAAQTWRADVWKH